MKRTFLGHVLVENLRWSFEDRWDDKVLSKEALLECVRSGPEALPDIGMLHVYVTPRLDGLQDVNVFDCACTRGRGTRTAV